MVFCGDELGVEVVGQLDVFLAEHQRGGGLGADDGVAVADGVAQHAEVRQGEVAGMIDVADDERGHARAALALGHQDVDLGLLEHGHDRFGELVVVIVGVDVHEVDRRGGPACCGRGRLSPSRAARRVNGVRRTGGSTRWRETPMKPLEQPARATGGTAGSS